jgi:hypothetical protein
MKKRLFEKNRAKDSVEQPRMEIIPFFPSIILCYLQTKELKSHGGN